MQIVLAEDHAQLVAANKRLTDACADIAKDRAEYFTKHEQLVALVKAWADAKKAYDANDNLSWSIRKSRHKRFMAAEVALLQARKELGG